MNLKLYLNKPLFTISLGKLEFKPGWLPTVVTVILLYALISLGQWQLDRAEYKDTIQQLVNERQTLTAIAYLEKPADIDEQLYLPVYIDGYFDASQQVLLDNRVVNHTVGYDVLTPFIMQNGKSILVNRGWIKQGKTRQDIPPLDITDKRIQINGLLAKPPQPGLVLAENANNYLSWPAVVQFIDLEQISDASGYTIEPMILLLDADDNQALHREPITFKTNSAKHHGYAFQWFGLATALMVIYLTVNTNRKVKK